MLWIAISLRLTFIHLLNSEDISKSPVVEIEVNQDAYPKRVEGAKPLWSTVWRKPTKMQRQSQRFLAPSYSYKGNMANDIHPY